jgi:hypothetical protein
LLEAGELASVENLGDFPFHLLAHAFTPTAISSPFGRPVPPSFTRTAALWPGSARAWWRAIRSRSTRQQRFQLSELCFLELQLFLYFGHHQQRERASGTSGPALGAGTSRSTRAANGTGATGPVGTIRPLCEHRHGECESDDGYRKRVASHVVPRARRVVGGGARDWNW